MGPPSLTFPTFLLSSWLVWGSRSISMISAFKQVLIDLPSKCNRPSPFLPPWLLSAVHAAVLLQAGPASTS